MHKLLLVAHHEFIRHIRRPSFIITTLALPLVGLIITLVVGALNGGQTTPASPTPDQLAEALRELDKPIGYVDQADIIARVPVELPADSLRAYSDEAAAREAVTSGTIGAYYLLPADYLASGRIVRVAQRIEPGPRDTTLFAALLRANLLVDADPRIAERLAEPINAEVLRLDDAGKALPAATPADQIDTNPLVFFVPYVFTMLLYFAIVFASGFMLQSVTEEKENRTIELLLTSLRPWQLLAGKVLGLGLLGLVQLVVWLVSSALLLGLVGTRFEQARALALPGSVWALAVVYFLLGYMVYASLLAGVGATITNPREGSQLTLVVLTPLIVPLWFISVIVTAPDSAVATALSIFPLTAPVTMLMRVVLGSASWWQVVLSLVLLAGTVVLCVWLAARLFRVSTLLTGKKLSLGEIARALRTATN